MGFDSWFTWWLNHLRVVAANVLHLFAQLGLVKCFHHSVISQRARILFDLSSVVLGRGLL